jgi:hypothetical protein
MLEQYWLECQTCGGRSWTNGRSPVLLLSRIADVINPSREDQTPKMTEPELDAIVADLKIAITLSPETQTKAFTKFMDLKRYDMSKRSVFGKRFEVFLR